MSYGDFLIAPERAANPNAGPQIVGSGEAVLIPDPTQPSGYRRVPTGNSAEAREAEDATTAAQIGQVQAQQGLQLIDSILANPNLDQVTGMVQGRLPPRTQGQQDLIVQIEQLQGQAFMQAFETLKGGGQITEREGAAATAAGIPTGFG